MTLARARIIKAKDLPDEVMPALAHGDEERTRVVRRELLDAREEAERIIATAEATAKERLSAVADHAAAIRKAAAEEGHQERLARAAAEVTTRIAREQEHAAQNVERIVELARLLSERLLGRALEQDERSVRDMALTLLAEVRGARRVTLRAHPDDVPRLEHALAETQTAAQITVTPSETLGRGDFRLETDLGSLEGSLGSRLELLANKLLEGLRT